MRIKEIYYSSRFEKSFKKLPSRVQEKATRKQEIFQQDCFHPSLSTHALSGNLDGLHAFSINYFYRILFKFELKDSVTFLDVGTHSIY